METIAFCEIDPFCQKVLRKHWSDVPIHEDIKTLAYAPSADARGRERLAEGQESSDGQSPFVLFDSSRRSGESGSGNNHGGRELYRGTIDLVCGGFPCQPFSYAGKRAGKEDDRHLWPEMCRVISEVQPAWVLGENVAGIIGMELDQVLSDLEALGYSTGAFVIPACAVDAPHRRDRVWIIGNTNGGGESALPVDAEASGVQALADARYASRGPHDSRRHGMEGEKRIQPGNRTETDSLARDNGEDVADAASNGCRQVEQPEQGRERKKGAGGEVKYCGEPRGWAGGLSQSRMGNLADGISRWLDEPDIPRVATGITDRVSRLRALGNSVVPQVVEVIGRAIMEHERQRLQNN